MHGFGQHVGLTTLHDLKKSEQCVPCTLTKRTFRQQISNLLLGIDILYFDILLFPVYQLEDEIQIYAMHPQDMSKSRCSAFHAHGDYRAIILKHDQMSMTG